jgi:thioredoxin 1
VTAVARVTAATIDAVLNRSRVVLVEFSADWCAACRPMAEIIEEIAVERAGQAAVATIDVALHPDAAERFDVRSLPTSIVFVDGVAARRLLGACTKRRLLRDLDEVIVEVESVPS